MRRAPTLAAAVPALELAALAGFAAARASGYAAHVDLHPADELMYLQHGLAMLRGEAWPDPAMSPVYSLLVGAVHLVLPNGWFAADVVHALLLWALAFVGWWSFRPVVPAPFGVATACWLLELPTLLQDGNIGGPALPNVYAAGLLGLGIALGAWVRGWRTTALLAAVATVLVRSEVALWLLTTAVCCVPVRRRLGTRWLALLALAGAAATLAVPLHPSLAARSWLTFQQHYAGHAVLRRMQALTGNAAPVDDATALQAWFAMRDAFATPDVIVAEDFPGASSMREAAAIAPAKFSGFVASNVAALPAAWLLAVAPRGVSPAAALAGLGGLTALAVAGAVRRRRRGEPTAAAPLPVLPPLLALPCCALSAAFVAARPELLLPTFWLLAWALARGLAGWRAPGGWNVARVPVAIAVLLAAAFAPGPFARPPLHAPALRDAILLVQSHPPAAGSRILCSNDLALRLLARSPGVDYVSLRHELHWTRSIATGAVNGILLDDDLRQESGVQPDWPVVATRGACRLLLAPAASERGK